MELSHAVTQKLNQDVELADALRNAKPNDEIPSVIMLFFKLPEMPKTGRRTFLGTPLLTEKQSEEHLARAQIVSDQVSSELQSIDNLTILNLSRQGFATMRGTASAIINALELDCITSGIVADREVIGPACAAL